jgi:hypothetical protein
VNKGGGGKGGNWGNTRTGGKEGRGIGKGTRRGKQNGRQPNVEPIALRKARRGTKNTKWNEGKRGHATKRDEGRDRSGREPQEGDKEKKPKRKE